MAPARVTVTRRSAGDAGEREIFVSLDGAPIATLPFGASVTREVDPGPHRLRVHNTLVWKTLEFDVAAGDDARFTVVNRPVRGTTGLLSILGARMLAVDFFRDEQP